MAEDKGRQLSKIERQTGAMLWLQLADFIRFAADKLPGFREDPNKAAQRYIGFLMEFGPEQWAQVEAHLAEHLEKRKLETQSPSDEVSEFEASEIAMQYRRFFGFAAQYTVHPLRIVHAYIREHYGISVQEWSRVGHFVESHERNWKV